MRLLVAALLLCMCTAPDVVVAATSSSARRRSSRPSRALDATRSRLGRLFSSNAATTPPLKVDKVKCPQEVQDFLTRRVEMEAFNSSSSLRGLSDAAFQKRVRGQRCAIVGNSGMLTRPPFRGDAIDAHDVVLRFNQAPITNYSHAVGSKTTFRLTNKVWSWRYSFSKRNGTAMHTKWSHVLPRETGLTLMVSRTGPELFNEIAEVAEVEHPHTSALKLNRGVTRLAQDFVRDFRQCVTATTAHRFEGGTSPSSGLLAITILVGLCKSITLFGIGGAWGAAAGDVTIPYQYYEWLGTQQADGNPTHSFAAEKALMQFMSQEKMVQWCSHDDVSPACTMPPSEPRASPKRGR